MTTLKSIVLSSGLLSIGFSIAGLAFNGPALADNPQDPAEFNGVWRVTMTPDESTAAAGQQQFRDALLFHNGQLTADAFGKYGFRPGTFATSQANGFTSFVSMLVSTDRGETIWSGQLSDDSTLTGTLVWVRADGTTFSYDIKGNRDEDGDGVDESEQDPPEESQDD